MIPPGCPTFNLSPFRHSSYLFLAQFARVLRPLFLFYAPTRFRPLPRTLFPTGNPRKESLRHKPPWLRPLTLSDQKLAYGFSVPSRIQYTSQVIGLVYRSFLPPPLLRELSRVLSLALIHLPRLDHLPPNLSPARLSIANCFFRRIRLNRSSALPFEREQTTTHPPHR